MVKGKIFYKIPGQGYVSKTVIKGTKHIQKKNTGKMAGRKSVKGPGERIVRNRVTKDFTLVKKSIGSRGHKRSKRVQYNRGNFI